MKIAQQWQKWSQAGKGGFLDGDDIGLMLLPVSGVGLHAGFALVAVEPEILGNNAKKHGLRFAIKSSTTATVSERRGRL